ncbi:MAG TPA: aminopeptidase P family protein [Saprospiraceae bacterium]|nr:aminopeptidase P family protein [Saprospiraceae bacterium]
MTSLIPPRIAALKTVMNKARVDAYIIPTADPHQSEYVPEYWAGRYWISGFHGSAGTVVVTADHAGLWTDSRYFLQAELELKGSGIALHKLVAQAQAEYMDWICSQLKFGQTVGCDFWCFSLSQIQAFDKKLTEKGLHLKDCGDLMQDIWENRPELSPEPVYEHVVKYAGKSRESKLKSLREHMKQLKVDYILLSALDEIAYLLNLRGKDVHCNPVFISYLLVTMDHCDLFLPPDKLPEALEKKLAEDGVHVKNYFTIKSVVQAIKPGKKILIDPSTLNAKLSLQFPEGSLVCDASPVMKMKAIKSKAEIEHIRNVMEKDGAALVKSFMWLENLLKKSKTCTEHEFAMKIKEFRSQQALYVGESFDAIVGYNANGAIIHYKPDAKKSAIIKAKGILLVDSGGQYQDGTTDITRTIALSAASPEVKKQYTAVLMGHIALADAIFPEGTKGIQLDILARQYLWNMSLNFSHGTGHGVGYFMNVHEPPQGFVTSWNQRGQSEMLEGMLTSNEPGYYEVGSHGIRIENLVINTLHTKSATGNYLKFETVTLFPIDLKLVHSPMMTKQCINWLNNYHKEVYNRIAPHLDATEKKWLKEKCKAI